MSYSIDEQILLMLKGNNIVLEEVNEAIAYCLSIGLRTKIQPTLWKINMNGYRDYLTTI